MKLEHEVLKYLEEILGQPPELVSMDQDHAQGLPYFLVNSYRLFGADLFGKRFVLAQLKEDEIDTTPAEFAQQIARLQEHFKTPVALLLSHLEAYQRNRLVQMGVPFIVPKRQLFLPQLLIDLRERYPRAASRPSKHLSIPAQVVVLYQLLVEDVGDFSLRELARRTGYSAMTLTNVQDELEVCALCDTERVGRSKCLRFKFRAAKLWKKALPLLRSPVRSVKAVREVSPELLTMRSGLSALSEYTPINPDRTPTYAIKESEFKKALMNGKVVVAPDSYDASTMVELWAYDPAFIYNAKKESGDAWGDESMTRNVDVLSLYLSLKEDPDERIQGELNHLLESRLW